MYYAKSTGGFYDREIHGDAIPADAVEITEENHAALLAGQGRGKIIMADATGHPVLTDPPPPSLEQMAATERVWRDGELELADNEVRKHEDSDLAATATDGLWRAYRAALRAWPQASSFPDAAHRPVAPASEQAK